MATLIGIASFTTDSRHFEIQKLFWGKKEPFFGQKTGRKTQQSVIRL
jgi:hypothetical protein